MSDNELNQNEHEKYCVERIRNNLTPDTFFGFSIREIQDLEDLLDKVSPNKNSNDFPDFLFPNGLIEHFMITSSKENKKGAAHKIAVSKFQKQNEKAINLLSDEKPVYCNSLSYENHSYENLRSSFIKNWNKHIESLNKYRGDLKKCIFLVEYVDTYALSMLEDKWESINDFSVGDYKKPEYIHDYRLSRDKKMLEWLLEFSERVDCVIFVTEEFVELINLKGIQGLLSLLPYDYVIGPNMTRMTDRGTLL